MWGFWGFGFGDLLPSVLADTTELLHAFTLSEHRESEQSLTGLSKTGCPRTRNFNPKLVFAEDVTVPVLRPSHAQRITGIHLTRRQAGSKGFPEI